MAVAPETIIAALQEAESLERFSLENLLIVSEKLLPLFPDGLRRRASSLLERLTDETGEHQKLAIEIIERLRRVGEDRVPGPG